MASSVAELAARCKKASLELAASSFETRISVLRAMVDGVEKAKAKLLEANEADCEAAAKAGLDGPAIRRLRVSDAALKEALEGLVALSESKEDIVGKCQLAKEIATGGLELYRVSCPVGTLCVIYEARPLVGVQIASLAALTGNGVILKGGSEAQKSNEVVFSILQQALVNSKVNPDAIQMVSTRTDVSELLKQDNSIDLVIPRGSNALVRHVKANTNIAVLGHADGICSVYADATIDDIPSAVKVLLDAKTNYPAACNAVETLLVNAKIAEKFLPEVEKVLSAAGVSFVADEACRKYLKSATLATEQDFKTEFLDLKLAVKQVSDVKEAISHINSHGSHHTDVILTNDISAADAFLNGVDSAGVYHNCSSRFADGFRYGFGTEVGISTNKIHSRGPVGLEGLLIYKYKLIGKGHTATEMGKTWKYTHKELPIPARVDSVGEVLKKM